MAEETITPSNVAERIQQVKVEEETFQESALGGFESSTIIVKNIPPQDDTDTLQALTDFFSFCGHIVSITLVPDESDPSASAALITFENVGAARTSLLLNHTALQGRSLQIELAPENLSSIPPPDDIKIEINVLPTKPSVLNDWVNKGSQISQEAFQKAKDLDEEHKITQSMNTYAKAVEQKVTEIDTAYGVSERIHEVTTKVNSIDEQYGITKSINTAVLSASQQVQDVDQKYQISQQISGAIGAAAAETSRLADELELQKRAEAVGESVTYASAQVSEFFETNETAKAVSTSVSAFGAWASSGIYSAFGWSQPAPQPVFNQKEVDAEFGLNIVTDDTPPIHVTQSSVVDL